MPNHGWMPGAHREQFCVVSMASFTGNFFSPYSWKDLNPSDWWLSLCRNKTVSLFFHWDTLHTAGYCFAVLVFASFLCVSASPSIHPGEQVSGQHFMVSRKVCVGRSKGNPMYHSRHPAQSLGKFGANSKSHEETWMGFPEGVKGRQGRREWPRLRPKLSWGSCLSESLLEVQQESRENWLHGTSRKTGLRVSEDTPIPSWQGQGDISGAVCVDGGWGLVPSLHRCVGTLEYDESGETTGRWENPEKNKVLVDWVPW